jgi:voltage-gated potassium channel Kch
LLYQTPLIATVAVAFVLALAFGFLAARLRVPPLVGYLLAGIALGPFTPGLVADASLAAQLADVGVILLMFGVGLHFSFIDLLKMRRVALPGALAQMAAATGLGALLAMFWGWGLGAAALNSDILESAGIAGARLLILAIPDAFQAEQILLAARRITPAILSIVRIHSESQVTQLRRSGATLTVLGERELALTMANHALEYYGSPQDDRRRIIAAGSTS